MEKAKTKENEQMTKASAQDNQRRRRRSLLGFKKPEEVDGKKWHWCSHKTGGKCKGICRRHTPKQCKGTAKPLSKEEKEDDDSEEPATKKVRTQKSFAATAEDGDESK